jgi:hypothetical protein
LIGIIVTGGPEAADEAEGVRDLVEATVDLVEETARAVAMVVDEVARCFPVVTDTR